MNLTQLLKRKHKLSENKQVGIETVELIKNDDPIENLSRLRLLVNPANYDQIIQRLEKFPSSKTHILDCSYKKKVKDLDDFSLIYINFDVEFFWAKNILLKNQVGINKFVKLSVEYSRNILLGDFAKVEEILSEIETEFGQSIWLIKNRIASLQLSLGLEAQKKYSQNIKDELRDGSLPRFITHWTSIRNENQTSFSRFVTQLEPTINRIDLKRNPGYDDYCRYHLLSEDITDLERMAQILRLEYSSSIIDYYEAFVNLAQCISQSNEDKSKAKLLRFFNSEKFNIDDSRLSLLHGLLDEYIDCPIAMKDNILCYDYFIEGDYEKAFLKAIDLLDSHPDDPMLINILAYSKAFKEKEHFELEVDRLPTLRDQIIANLSSIIKKGVIKSSKEVNEINKIYINFSNCHWASLLSIIVRKESKLFNLNKRSIRFLNIPYLHPALIEYADKSDRIYCEKNIKTYGDTVSCVFFRCLKNFEYSSKLDNIDKSFNVLLNGLIAYKNNSFIEAVNFGDLLIDSEQDFFIRRGFSIVSYSYLKLNDLISTIRVVADCYVKRKDYYTLLPLFEICQQVKPNLDIWDDLQKTIDLSIVFDAIVKNIDRTAEAERRFSYEDFLTSNNCEKPSHLKSYFHKFEHQKMIYYLRYICVESNMDTSSAFVGGSEEVLAERLAICRILCELDPENMFDYETEIKLLVKRQIINKRTQEVDQSRIYVDVESVKELSYKELSESFSRYIEYLKVGLNNVNKQKRARSIVDSSIGIMNIPEDEVNALFRYIVEEIKKAYIGSDFGLNRFLSTRVRHGILEGKLRKPIESYHLITKKLSKNGPYLPNTYWLAKMNGYESGVIKEVERSFAKFSDAYDKLIQKILEEWLQVNRPNKPLGLFRFDIHESDIDMLGSVITIDTSFNGFIDKVIHVLEQILIVNLIGVRKELNTNAKHDAKRLLNNLQESIQFLSGSVSTELNTAINQARTEMQNQFDIVTEWFIPSSTGSTAPFLIEDAILVAEALVKETTPSFAIQISESDDGFFIHGQLPIFVDIFINIFENVVKRSGLVIPTANVDIHYKPIDSQYKMIDVTIENEIVYDGDISAVVKELNRKKSLLMNGDYAQYLAIEGNSGLFKIHKSVMGFSAVGSTITPLLDFGIIDSTFQIVMSIPFQMFEVEEEK